MSSDRFNVQVLIEREIGCSNPADLAINKAHFKSKIESIQVGNTLSVELKSAAALDTSNTFFKASLSIVEAVEGIAFGAHSWSIVKLYYAIFYLLRCKMATMDCYFFKCAGNIYSVSPAVGSRPILRSKGKFLGMDVRGDHKTVLATYIGDIGASDPLLSNRIDSVYIFQWIMGAREDIHYRNPKFAEPNLEYLDPELFSKEKLSYWINKYYTESTAIHCFLKEHTCLATPLIVLRETLIGFNLTFNMLLLPEGQTNYLLTRLSRFVAAPNELNKLLKSASTI